MTMLLYDSLAVLLVVAALAAFSAVMARRIEKAVPPQGGFLDLDGERLHVLDKGAGRPVVMIHGLSGQMGNFTHSLVDRLSADFRVVAFDRPGSGYSTRPAAAPAGIRAQGATLASAIRKLELDEPGDRRPFARRRGRPGDRPRSSRLRRRARPDLAGDPPGGVDARGVPRPRPPGVAAAAPVRRLDAGDAGRAHRRAAGRTGRCSRRNRRRPISPRAGGGLLALRPGNVYASSSDLMAATRLREDIESMTRRYGSLVIPVGILFGRSDPILDWREHGEAMKRELPALDLEIVEGGHMLPVTQPDVCAAFIRRMAAKTKEREGVR